MRNIVVCIFAAMGHDPALETGNLIPVRDLHAVTRPVPVSAASRESQRAYGPEAWSESAVKYVVCCRGIFVPISFSPYDKESNPRINACGPRR